MRERPYARSMTLRRGLALCLAAVSVLVGCTGSDQVPEPQGPEPGAVVLNGPTATVPPGPSCDAGGRTQTVGREQDYSDFVKFGGQTYQLAREDAEVILAVAVGRVRCRLAGSGTPNEYVPTDGDAAFLPAGTRLYRIQGLRLADALAVRRSGSVSVYEARN